MSGFVDIHSHILWGLDDGPADLKSSLEMLRLAAETGTTDIVATPHADLRFHFRPDEIERRIAELNQSEGPKPRIHWGCDFHLHFDNITSCLANPSKYTINHLRYLLVEFADLSIPKSIDKVFDRMLQTGITPIITHPERNPILSRDLPRILQWIHAGCLTQVTGQSFLGKFGSQAQHAAEHMMSRGMVHFIASDGHDTVQRPPDLSAAYKLIAKRYGPDIAMLLFCTNPAATLTGEWFETEMPEFGSARRKWYQFW
jgi:protein-tyrosine phosphatase